MNLLIGILIPFAGTSLGAACVFLLKDAIEPRIQKALLGFAAGVMTAASVWSLLIPSIEQSAYLNKLSFIPAVVGFSLGVAFLLLMDRLIPHLHVGSEKPEGIKSNIKKNTMLLLAITLHNIPEGMAVGVVFAGALAGNTDISVAGAIALAIGIAIQNFPEGAVVSIPLKNEQNSKGKAFLYGVLSGAVEPVSSILTILLTSVISPVLPYILSFAAGTMIYVVVEELIPEASQGEHSNLTAIGFAIGFMVMMVLDVVL